MSTLVVAQTVKDLGARKVTLGHGQVWPGHQLLEGSCEIRKEGDVSLLLSIA